MSRLNQCRVRSQKIGGHSTSTPIILWIERVIQSKSLQARADFSKFMIFIASIPSCIRFSLIIGLVVKYFLKQEEEKEK